MAVKITADRTCDPSKELIDKYGVLITPPYITRGMDQQRDGVGIKQSDVFEYFEKTGQLAKTAAVSQGDYMDVFEPILKEGNEIVHIDISASMSVCNRNANAAAEELGGVYVVDSKNLSTGSGLLVLMACELAQAGKSAKEIADTLNEARERVDASFVINTLEYLRKGGRCSALAALGANMLKLKPCIEVKDGAMGVGKKYRGNMSKVIPQYVAERLADISDIDTRRIFVTHTCGTDRQLVDAAIEAVKAAGDFDEIIETEAGCTIASHCGPNTLGVLFFHKQ